MGLVGEPIENADHLLLKCAGEKCSFGHSFYPAEQNLSVFMVLVLCYVFERRANLILTAVGLVLVCHTAKTIRRNLDWRDEETIFLSGLTVNSKEGSPTHHPFPLHQIPI